MADIFISYSKLDPDPTIALAADLEARGYTTWWDTSLLPGDDFPDMIKRRIDEAKVVIVIWTQNSVHSRWVRAEANRADDQTKLITVHAPGLDFHDIPRPFNTRHCEPVSDRQKLYAALQTRGVRSVGASSARDAATPSEDAAALYQRGKDYLNGSNGFPQDDNQAVAYYRRAADMGSAGAINDLGWMYAEGRGVPQDDAEAVRLYRKAADMGNAVAISNLGWMYQEGRGVPRDDAEAVRLLRKAADMGNAKAISNLGWMYGQGRGVSRDDAEAVRLYRKAADMGDAMACYNLAVMYEDGNGIERSREDARRWYQKAADPGDPDAIEALKRF